MNLPFYQYCKKLKCWIWIYSLQIISTTEMFWFPEGSFGYEANYFLIKKEWRNNYIKNIKTIQISLL